MMRPRSAAILALVASALGLIFAAYSTYDYAEHLDRQVHAVHCSFIPGAPVSTDADNPCKTALFSPYSALFRATYWGGIPISLFALGAFGFFAGFALYLFLGGKDVPERTRKVFGALSVTPLLASLVMFTLSLTRLHALCKVCVGIYLSSILLAVAGVAIFLAKDESPARGAGQRPGAKSEDAETSWLPAGAWMLGLAAAAILPAIVYVHALPDYQKLISKCGKLPVASESHSATIKMATREPKRAVTLFEDPLCPTCKAFHERLVGEGIFDRLDVTMVMFPLDSECNWMLDRALHPGACVLAKAVLCGDKEKSREILEWSYDNQEDLRALGKEGADKLAAKVKERWGGEVASCMTNKNTATRLNQNLLYASANHIPVSTPQMFIGDARVCDEDTDLGLKYTLAQLAPEVLP
jgi:uncharacterized membrane protein